MSPYDQRREAKAAIDTYSEISDSKQQIHVDFFIAVSKWSFYAGSCHLVRLFSSVQ